MRKAPWVLAFFVALGGCDGSSECSEARAEAADAWFAHARALASLEADQVEMLRSVTERSRVRVLDRRGRSVEVSVREAEAGFASGQYRVGADVTLRVRTRDYRAWEVPSDRVRGAFDDPDLAPLHMDLDDHAAPRRLAREAVAAHELALEAARVAALYNPITAREAADAVPEVAGAGLTYQAARNAANTAWYACRP